MANNLFNMLAHNQQPNFMGMLQQLRANPIQFLMQRKFNLPTNFQGGPQEIVQHLISTGQISQQQVNDAISRFTNR